MAKFDSDTRGGIDDRVRLELAGKEVLIAENYEVSASILEQPSTFTLRLGHGSVVRDLIGKYPPLTAFRLFIGPVLQQTGNIDDPVADGATGATTFTLTGRDALARIHDNEVDAEESFANLTVLDFVKRVLRVNGLPPSQLRASAEADRSLRAGVKVTQFSNPIVATDIVSTGSATSGSTTTPVSKKAMQARLGEKWFHTIRRQIDREGFFFWAGADGTFILSAPNTNQKPIYRIVRRRGQSSNAVNVVSASFANATRGRHSVAVIYGRGGGRKAGWHKAITATTDDEMVQFLAEAFGTGTHRKLVIRDAAVHTVDQAAFLGQRKLAEERRAGWRLEYVVSGHTTPAIGTSERAVWTPDTMVEVDDQEFGIAGNFWIESCQYRRGPETTTTIRLMRVTDLIFGSDEEDEP